MMRTGTALRVGTKISPRATCMNGSWISWLGPVIEPVHLSLSL
jgi:hypothetical protein